MDFYQVAMQMEGQGRAFYLSLADKAQNAKLKKLFGMLADEEQNHYELFRKMSQNAPVDETNIGIISAEQVFSEMISEGVDFGGEENLVEAYQKAKQLEDQTVAFYKDCLTKTQRSADKVVLLKLYYEEKKHSLFLEHLIELISDPVCHLASAEWDRTAVEDV